MPIAFSRIPANWKMPLFWSEIDPSMAGYSTPRQPALLVGTMLPGGDAMPDVAVPIASQAQADARFGMGSELAKMFKAHFANNFANEVWGVGVAEAPLAVKASGTVTVATPATDAGTIHLYVGAEHVPVNIGLSDTEEEIADAIATAINDLEWLPVVAASPNVVPPSPPAPPFNATLPALSMAPQEGVAATCTSGTWSGNPAPTYAYQWQADNGGGYTDIVGATTSSYTPVTGDIGATLKVIVTATNSQAPGGVTAESNESDPIISALSAPVNLTAPVLSDTVIAGHTHRGRGRPSAYAMAPEDVTITCKWGGLSGNDIRISLNYAGAIGGQELPPGLTLTLPPTGMLTGGTTVPSFANTISNLGETPVEYLALPYTDTVSLLAWENEFGFSDSGRWGWMRQLYGSIFSARRGSYSELIAFGGARNGAQTSVMGVEPTSPSPVYEWAAAYCAKAQRALSNDPARPLQTLTLDSILLAPPDGRFILSEANTLATYGIATQSRSADNVTPMIMRETTTYQLNLYGFADDAYELVTTLATLAALMRNQRYIITTKYARCKLANDGTRFGPGQRVATPAIIKAELVSQYRIDMFNGLCEDIRAFKNNLIVERDTNNPNRLNVLYPPDLINQLRIFAVLAQFRLQYDRGLDSLIAA
jgi:phage tail sheath gpL-like